MDYSPSLEYHLLYHALSAEDTLLEEETRREQEEAHELMLQRLRDALATLTPTQARRLHARFVEGKKYREIAEDEGIASVSLVTNTVRDAILKLRKYFIKHGWKNHREDTTDWNDKGNVEIWRAAWAAYTNRALESAGRPERIDHRSSKRQGIDKIPSVHLGPTASQMEKRGIRTDKGEVNRQIAADNKLLKEIKARITRLYRWSKAETEKPQTQQSSLTALWEAQQQLNAPRTRTGKIRALQESAALFSFLQANGIQSMQQLHEKIADMNSRYYDLRGKIVKAERRIATLTERGEMWEQYNQYKSIHKQLAKVKPEKREQFEQRHSRELILYDAAARYLKELKGSGEGITPKAWQREIDQLAPGKQTDTLAMKSMREDLKAVERLRKTAEQLSRQERDKSHDREPER